MIQTLITFDGTLSSWWTRIVIGALLFVFCLLQRVIERHAARRKSGGTGAHVVARERGAGKASATRVGSGPVRLIRRGRGF